jgi:hypothetical protein
LLRFRREGSLEYLNLRVCACVHACMYVCAIAPTNEVGGLTRPSAKPTSEPTVDHDRSAAGSSDDRATSAGSTAASENAQSRRIHLCLAGGSAPTEATSARRSTVQRKTTPGSPGKRRPTARPERKRRCLGLSGNRLGFRSQWIDSRSARRSLRNGAWVCVHRCERRQAVRPASIDGTARASTPQCATPPAADHSSDLGRSRERAATT